MSQPATATHPRPWTDGLGLERRAVRFSDRPEIRAEGGGIQFRGHAAVFNVRSSNLGGFVEVVRRGAFAKTIQEADIRFLHNHDENLILGRRRGRETDTLSLREDETGLLVEATFPATTYAADLAESIRRGDIDQMSFGFRTIADNWTVLPDGTYERELLEVALLDVSTVTFPAYQATDAAIRAARFDNLFRALGWADLPDEQRQEVLDRLARGDSLAGLDDVVRTALDRLASQSRAGEEPRGESADEESPTGSLALFQLRHRALATRYGFITHCR